MASEQSAEIMSRHQNQLSLAYGDRIGRIGFVTKYTGRVQDTGLTGADLVQGDFPAGLTAFVDPDCTGEQKGDPGTGVPLPV